MYNDLEVGDILTTGFGGMYMISKFKGVYVATTLDSDYIGTICYYNETHEDIVDLAIAIGAEEGGIIKVINRRTLQSLLDN